MPTLRTFVRSLIRVIRVFRGNLVRVFHYYQVCAIGGRVARPTAGARTG